MKYKNYSKAGVLKKIKDDLSLFRVPDLISFNAIKFINDRNFYIDQIKKITFGPLLVVRSSAADEDGGESSSAGEYDSFLNISASSSDDILNAIDKVIESYQKKRSLLDDDEIIIQKMIERSSMSGVIFTHDLNTGAPYYVINYDDQSGLTDTVTSGYGEYSNRTLYIHRNATDKLNSERFKKLLKAVNELELVMDSQFLDIEFALGEDLSTYLLQVRSITTHSNWNRAITNKIDNTLWKLESFVERKFKKIEGIHGETTVLGQMPDWNPIEMIGRAPRALASSLYQSLITDNAWSLAREKMGYMVPTGQPLMLMLAGQPFIDVRLSFHSYIPKNVTSRIASKLVSHWINKLKEFPQLHDKVEFDVAITTFSFDFDKKIEDLVGNSLTEKEKQEFKNAHLNQTVKLIKGEDKGSLETSLLDIEKLRKKQENYKIHYNSSRISSLFSMIADCITYGTVPFSILARHGFIAKTMLISIYKLGIITKDDFDNFQSSIRTVASDLVTDMQNLQLNKISIEEFMSKYGHLRPGTYDILSKRYDQMTDIAGFGKLPDTESNLNSFVLSDQQKKSINKLLKDNNFGDFDAEDLFIYMHDATVAREYGKFIFTKSVSNMLELISNFSEKNGLSRDEISHVPVNRILDAEKISSEHSIEESLRFDSDIGKENHLISSAIRLPQIMIDKSDVHVIPFFVSHPNFITIKSVTSTCFHLISEIEDPVLENQIVLIEGADPGFDWIFSQNIAGLITKYGGANSHMAIRCAEFGIPAAIGCGEQRFDRILKSNKVHLDCSAGIINPLN